jgi:hypothetical protein
MIESDAFGWCNLRFGLGGHTQGRTHPDAALVALECSRVPWQKALSTSLFYLSLRLRAMAVFRRSHPSLNSPQGRR